MLKELSVGELRRMIKDLRAAIAKDAGAFRHDTYANVEALKAAKAEIVRRAHG